ncbi:MAG: PHP domain-containing protein, partial [Vulcanimicrobiaceae bacterium]
MDTARCKGSRTLSDPRIAAIPDIHGHAKGEHKLYSEERPIAYSARMLFLWFYHACRRGLPRFLMVTDHVNYLTFEDPGAVNTVRRALKLAEAGDLYGAAETAGVDVTHAAIVSEGLRRGMRFSIGAEIDNDPRARPDAQNIVDAMRPDGMIRSVHFLAIDHPEKGADWQWPFDNAEFKGFYEIVGVEKTWQLYMAKLLDDIEKLPGHIVGHFYVPATFGHWPDKATLERYEDQLIDACRARGMAIEINTRFLYRDAEYEGAEGDRQRYRAANLRLMKKAKAKGVGIAIGSDAHSPKDQGGMFDFVLKMLDEAGINEIVFPVGGRLARVALRATKEHLEKAKSQEPPLAGSSITGFGRAELGLPERDEAAELREAKAAAKARHAAGPKRRAGGSSRATKGPAKEPSARGGAPRTTRAKKPKTAAEPHAAAPQERVASPKRATPTKKPAPAKKSAPTKKPAPAKKLAPT